MERTEEMSVMRWVRKGFLAIAGAAVVTILTAPAMAQSKPDFSGAWTLNADKSDFGQVPGPTSETLDIKQSGSNLNESVNFADEQGSHSYVLDMTIDGPEVTYSADKAPQLGMVSLQKVKASWQGTSLVINETLKYEADADVTGANTYSLSADGKTLTMDMTFSTPMGNMTRKIVFDKGGASSAAMASNAASSTKAMSSSASTTTTAPSASSTASASTGPAPNLSGTWKLNISKSDFGQFPPPDSRKEEITDNEPNIKIVSTWTGGPMGDGTMSVDLVTNGKETAGEAFGMSTKNTARWEGSALLVNTTLQSDNGDATVKSAYNVSPDGKTLTVAAHISGPMGEMDMKSVYDKQ